MRATVVERQRDVWESRERTREARSPEAVQQLLEKCEAAQCSG